MRRLEYEAPIAARLVPERSQLWRVYKEHTRWVSALRMPDGGSVIVPVISFRTWREAYDWANFGWINDC